MTPAKATRPGFRQSMAVTAANQDKAEGRGVHLFHPIYHTFATPIRSRIDVDRSWPVHLEDSDPEELIDVFSEPPQFVERLSPVSVQFGDTVLKGHNWTEVRVKILRHSIGLFANVSRMIEATMQGARPGRIPFASFSLDPDTIHRVIELDYESGESTYQQLMTLFAEGIVTPGLTVPFHTLLPLLSDTEIRLLGRISFVFYHRILLKHVGALKKRGDDDLLVVPFWIPESAYQRRIVEILDEEFHAFCKREKFPKPHLVFLLDVDQADFKENDVLMKSWNVLRTVPSGPPAPEAKPAKNGRAKNGAAASPRPGPVEASIVFRDRSFSDWVAYSNPSVKKLLDRTIAKVDSDLNNVGVHYGWAHFEDLDALAHNSKSVLNFKQKLVKLAELGYIPLSPDVFVRGKLNGLLPRAEQEPRLVDVRERSATGEADGTFTRWQGVKKTGDGHVVADTRRYMRPTADSPVEEEAPQCWKLAWNLVRDRILGEIVGDLDSLSGILPEELSELSGQSSPARTRECVLDFLAAYTHVYWREHFIQHDLSEADINIHEMANERLRAGVKAKLSEAQAARAGVAAQGIFFALDSGRSTGTRYDHMDQRAFYQNVVMLTLAACNAVILRTWRKDSKGARRILDLIKTELVGFEDAYARHDLQKHGVKKKDWEKALESHVSDSRHNVVRRAATRVAAIQLRPMGYVRDFSREDELTTTNVGHLWADEIANPNCKYENPHFCGVREI